MTYNDTDGSVAAGRPKLLFDFADDFGTHWRFNTSLDDVTFLGFSYTADRCSMSELELTANPFRSEVEVNLSRGNTFATPFVSGPLESKITLTVYRLLDPGDSSGSFYIIYWFGLLLSVRFDKDAKPILKCVPRTTSASRVGRRRVAQVMCDVALYSQELGECLLDRELFKIIGTLTSIAGMTLISPDFNDEADDWLKGGEIVIGNARRLITSHTNDSGGGIVIISRPISNPETDSGGNLAFVAYAGCDHIASTCLTKFNNKINYAGQEHKPVKNPFVGDAIID